MKYILHFIRVRFNLRCPDQERLVITLENMNNDIGEKNYKHWHQEEGRLLCEN